MGCASTRIELLPGWQQGAVRALRIGANSAAATCSEVRHLRLSLRLNNRAKRLTRPGRLIQFHQSRIHDHECSISWSMITNSSITNLPIVDSSIVNLQLIPGFSSEQSILPDCCFCFWPILVFFVMRRCCVMTPLSRALLSYSADVTTRWSGDASLLAQTPPWPPSACAPAVGQSGEIRDHVRHG